MRTKIIVFALLLSSPANAASLDVNSVYSGAYKANLMAEGLSEEQADMIVLVGTADFAKDSCGESVMSMQNLNRLITRSETVYKIPREVIFSKAAEIHFILDRRHRGRTSELISICDAMRKGGFGG